jgi:hypothetical protein
MRKKQNKDCATSVAHYGEDYHKPTCRKCDSASVITGAGRKPNEMSLKCCECKAFIGYTNLEKLKRLRRQKELTPCLELLEKQGISSDAAVFVLGQLGGAS